MLRTHFALWLLLAAGVLSSCANTERVQVGTLATSIDFSTCLGTDTRCEQRFPPAREMDTDAAPTQCDFVEDDAWQVAWWRKTTDLRCAPVGYCRADRVSVAEDGTSWTASLGRSPIVDSDDTLVGLFLAHYDQDGEILAQEVVETQRLSGGSSVSDASPIQMAIAVDARGHVFVAMVWAEEEAWLGEFDAGARPVGQRIRLEGWQGSMVPQLYVATDGSVLLSARIGAWPPREQSDFNTLAKLDSSFWPVWLQTRALPPSGLYKLLAGGPGLSVVGDTGPQPGVWNTTQVGTLDSTGNLVNLLHMPLTYAPFALDRTGNLFTIAPSVEGPVIATKVTPQGDVLFQVEVVGVQERNKPEVRHVLSATADLEGNSFYAMHWDEWDEWDEQGTYREILTLWQLDADGERCSVSNIVNALGGAAENIFRVDEVQKLFRTDDGDLYLWTVNGIARLTR